ncbi:hypothetical protein T459_14466 [Capsicum annuum]|uniref:Uncharacterized protein n=1 Tax=Capsicum annuum TaxID=4072 RepID=A0A2G2ZHQ2_CAPAN|nr:hypothetical protein T459_14466 [Capsicum annuum]
MERIANTIESRTSTVSRESSFSIKNAMTIVRNLSGMIVGSDLWWKASGLLVKQSMREMFIEQEDAELQLQCGDRVVGSGIGIGSGNGVAGGSNDASLAFFETTNQTSFTDFALPSKCSTCKCQNCKAKYDGVINDINALTTSVKKLTSKRGVIPSKRILYLGTPLDIKVAKRRRKEIFKALSSIDKSKIATPLYLSYTFEQCTMATGEQHDLKKVHNCKNSLCPDPVHAMWIWPLPSNIVNHILIPFERRN